MARRFPSTLRVCLPLMVLAALLSATSARAERQASRDLTWPFVQVHEAAGSPTTYVVVANPTADACDVTISLGRSSDQGIEASRRVTLAGFARTTVDLRTLAPPFQNGVFEGILRVYADEHPVIGEVHTFANGSFAASNQLLPRLGDTCTSPCTRFAAPFSTAGPFSDGTVLLIQGQWGFFSEANVEITLHDEAGALIGTIVVPNVAASARLVLRDLTTYRGLGTAFVRLPYPGTLAIVHEAPQYFVSAMEAWCIPECNPCDSNGLCYNPSSPSCHPTCSPEMCSNRRDDDCDGLIDAADSDCGGGTLPAPFPNAPTCSLTSSVAMIESGGSANLVYNSTNGSALLIAPTVGAVPIGSGTRTVTPATTTTYTLTVTGVPGSTPVICQTTVNVCGTAPPTAARLTVVKNVVNDDGGTATVESFKLYVGDARVTSGTANVFPPGAYVVREDNLAGYTGTFGGDCSSNGSVTLAAGDDKTCTLTNNDQFVPAGTLTCSPANQTGLTGQSLTFMASGGTAPFTFTTSGGSPSSGTGTSFSTAFSTAGEQTVTVADGAGQSATCHATINTAPASSTCPATQTTGDVTWTNLPQSQYGNNPTCAAFGLVELAKHEFAGETLTWTTDRSAALLIVKDGKCKGDGPTYFAKAVTPTDASKWIASGLALEFSCGGKLKGLSHVTFCGCAR